MNYKDLDKNLKAKINGTLSSLLRGTSYDSWDEVYKDFVDRKIFVSDKGIYYNEKPYKEYDDESGEEIQNLKEEYKLDAEFLDDIKKIIEERFNKRTKVEKVTKEEKEKSFDDYMESNKATDKQKRYASRLYKQFYGEKKEFDDKDYSMKEMSDIIQELLGYIEKKRQESECRVIEVDFKNKGRD